MKGGNQRLELEFIRPQIEWTLACHKGSSHQRLIHDHMDRDQITKRIYCTIAYQIKKDNKRESSRHDHYFVAATIEALARVKAEINDPSCNLSLHAILSLYSISAISLIS